MGPGASPRLTPISVGLCVMFVIYITFYPLRCRTKQDSQNRLWSSMPDRGDPFAYLLHFLCFVPTPIYLRIYTLFNRKVLLSVDKMEITYVINYCLSFRSKIVHYWFSGSCYSIYCFVLRFTIFGSHILYPSSMIRVIPYARMTINVWRDLSY